MEYLESAIAMSPSQFGVYQSKVVSHAVQQTRQWLDWGNTALRWVKLKALWTAQTLLYPVYVVFQTVRLAGAEMRQAIELGATNSDGTGAIATPDSDTTLTADTPIQNALLTVQAFSLSTDLAVALEPPNAALTVNRPLAPVPRSLAVVAARTISKAAIAFLKWGGQLANQLSQSRPIHQFQAGKFQLPTVSTATYVQGLATLLETRSMVLVTDQNQVLDVLSVVQQEQLHQRIDWEVSRYGRYRQLRQASKQALVYLNPLVQKSRQFLPADVFQQFAKTLQASPVYVAGAQLRQFVESRFPGLLPANLNSQTLIAGVGDRLRLGAATLLPTTETPLYQALCTAQQLTVPPSPVLPLPSAIPTHFIRGIASQMATRAIVLVTNTNEALDILTVGQQQQLHQKMIWEIACYRRYQHLRAEVRQVMTSLRPTAENRYLLPPVRLFRQLMAWLQTSPLAIATNQFQEAALPLPSLTSAAVPFLLLPSLSFQQLLAPLRPTMSLRPATENGRKQDGAIAVSIPRAIDLPLTAVSPSLMTAAAGVSDYAIAPSATGWDYIDTEAIPVGYVPSLLEKVLGWLDVGFLWIEKQVAQLWHIIHDDEWRIDLWQRLQKSIAKFF